MRFENNQPKNLLTDEVILAQPFGLYRDKSTNQIKIDEKLAPIIQLVFNKYAEMGSKRGVVKYLNDKEIPSPSYISFLRTGRKGRKDPGKSNVWNEQTVNKILKNEAYIGTLVCGKTRQNPVTHKNESVPVEEQRRYENAFPAIIEVGLWHHVQKLLKSQAEKTPGIKIQKQTHRHKYTGINSFLTIVNRLFFSNNLSISGMSVCSLAAFTAILIRLLNLSKNVFAFFEFIPLSSKMIFILQTGKHVSVHHCYRLNAIFKTFSPFIIP